MFDMVSVLIVDEHYVSLFIINLEQMFSLFTSNMLMLISNDPYSSIFVADFEQVFNYRDEDHPAVRNMFKVGRTQQ